MKIDALGYTFYKSPEGFAIIITGMIVFGFFIVVFLGLIIPLDPNIPNAEDQIIPESVKLGNPNWGCWDRKYKAWFDCNTLAFYPDSSGKWLLPYGREKLETFHNTDHQSN